MKICKTLRPIVFQCNLAFHCLIFPYREMTKFGILENQMLLLLCKIESVRQPKVLMQPFDCGFVLHLYKGLSPSPGLAWFAGLDQFTGTLACLLTTLNCTIT